MNLQRVVYFPETSITVFVTDVFVDCRSQKENLLLGFTFYGHRDFYRSFAWLSECDRAPRKPNRKGVIDKINFATKSPNIWGSVTQGRDQDGEGGERISI